MNALKVISPVPEILFVKITLEDFNVRAKMGSMSIKTSVSTLGFCFQILLRSSTSVNG